MGVKSENYVVDHNAQLQLTKSNDLSLALVEQKNVSEKTKVCVNEMTCIYCGARVDNLLLP